MTYLNLGAALFAAAVSLYFLGPLVRTAFTRARHQSYWGLFLDEVAFAFCATVSIWNFNLAVAA